MSAKMTTTKTTTSFLLLFCALLACSQTVFGDDADIGVNDLIPEWLPQCFDETNGSGNNPFGMVTCLRQNAGAQCFDLDSFQQIADCLGEHIPEDLGEETNPPPNDIALALLNATRVCLDPYVACVNATIQERIANVLPTCVDSSLQQLAQCARQNHAACRTPCAAAMPEDNSFAALDVTLLDQCDGIQTQVMNPACGVVGCCQPCVPHFVSLMNCVSNDVLGHTAAPCALDCPARRRLRENSPNRADNPIDESAWRRLAGDRQISNRCLQFAPGLTGGTARELAFRAQYFLPCVYDVFVRIMGEEEQRQKAQQQQGGGGGGVPRAALIAIVAVLIVLFVLGLLLYGHLCLGFFLPC